MEREYQIEATRTDGRGTGSCERRRFPLYQGHLLLGHGNNRGRSRHKSQAWVTSAT